MPAHDDLYWSGVSRQPFEKASGSHGSSKSFCIVISKWRTTGTPTSQIGMLQKAIRFRFKTMSMSKVCLMFQKHSKMTIFKTKIQLLQTYFAWRTQAIACKKKLWFLASERNKINSLPGIFRQRFSHKGSNAHQCEPEKLGSTVLSTWRDRSQSVQDRALCQKRIEWRSVQVSCAQFISLFWACLTFLFERDLSSDKDIAWCNIDN
jgi:hypothetical protein